MELVLASTSCNIEIMAREPSNKKAAERRPTGRPSATEAATRIESLLDIAAEVFMEKGYEGTSVGEIAHRANASKQTLYSRYPTKAELFIAVLNRRCEAGFLRAAEILHPDRPITEALTRFAAELIKPVVNDDWMRLHRTVIGAAGTFPEVGRMFWNNGPERAHQMMSNFILDRMNRGELRKEDPDEAAQLFLAMCAGRLWSRRLFGICAREAEAEVERYINQAAQMFLSIYAPFK